MGRGDPPDLPSLKHPEWLSEMVAALINGGRADIVPIITNQYLTQVMAEIQARTATPVRLAPEGASEAEQFEHYKRILETRGFVLDPDHPTVLTMRGMSHDGTLHGTTSSRDYDDTLVVLTRDANGDPHVHVSRGSTHPGQTEIGVGGSVGVPDVNNDGKADIGMIEPGEYRLQPRDGGHNGGAAWDVRTVGGSGDLPGVRDTNQDGQFTREERAASEALNDTLDGVMIHQGGAEHPASAGCVNVPSGEALDALVEAMGGEQTSAKLVVLDANAW